MIFLPCIMSSAFLTPKYHFNYEYTYVTKSGRTSKLNSTFFILRCIELDKGEYRTTKTCILMHNGNITFKYYDDFYGQTT